MKRLRACLIVALGCSVPAWAGQQPETNADSPVLKALRLGAEEEIAIDGLLDEAAWQRAEPAADFKQSDPRNGEPATERTEIRIVFDRNNLYIGAHFFDSNPKGLLGNQMVRDGDLSADDRFMWILDPFYDQRSGYFFEINAAGAMGDAQLVPAQGGSSFGTTQNRAWNGIWLARVRRHDEGWTADQEQVASRVHRGGLDSLSPQGAHSLVKGIPFRNPSQIDLDAREIKLHGSPT